MQLNEFINKVVIATASQKRMYLREITSPYLCTVTVQPEENGHYGFYSWPTINGDPFKNGYLVFEDASLMQPFREAYDAYCRTQDAYWEEYGYWMRRGG